MAPDFETWAMRGLVGVLGLAVAWFIKREVGSRDKDTEVLRAEFASALETISERFAANMSKISKTLDGLTTAVSDLRLMVGKEYATREEVQELEERSERRLRECKGTCQRSL